MSASDEPARTVPRSLLAAVLITVAHVLGVAVIAVLDYLTGPDLPFALFYLVPVAASAWFCGLPFALLVALAATAGWEAVSVLHLSTQPSIVIELWSVFSRLAFFVIVAWLLARQRAQQSALERANQRLANRNAELDAFAGRVAHDLRDALAPIANASAALSMVSPQGSPGVEIARVLERASAKALLTINALLSFARAEQPDVHERANVLEAVRAVLDELGPTLARSAIRVDVSIAPELAVRCDNGLLLVICSNVVGNAVKFLDGCPKRQIDITAAATGPWVELAIGDSGPGIPLAEQAQVFKPFFRGANRDVAAGMGIGLATVERIVSSRGGQVTVSSSSLGGACFVIRLPRA